MAETNITLATSIGVLEPQRVRIHEGLSEAAEAEIVVLSDTDLDLEDALESDMTLTLRTAEGEQRFFQLKLAEAEFAGLEEGHLSYRLSLRPAFWFTRFGQDLRKFRDKTTEQIVGQILSDQGVAHAFRNVRACDSRPYCVQYRETHFDFVSRLLEFEGIYYLFEEDGEMTMHDRSSASPYVDGIGALPLLEGGDALSQGEAGITAFERGARVGTGKATVNDYNWRTPKLSLLKSHVGAKDKQLEVYDYPVGYRAPGQGAVLAQLRSEAFEAEKRFVKGKGNVVAFTAGRLFDFQHDEATHFSGSYLLRRVIHHYSRAHRGRAARYENEFFAIPSDVPFRPMLSTPRPEVQGNHTAMVRGPAGEEIHTDKFGRYKAQFHWDREAKGTDDDSRWIRKLQETASSMNLARVGWETSVGYIAGDPDRPVGLTRQINGKMRPTYGQPSLKNVMTVKTETYPGKVGFNELRIDDSAGKMRLDWKAERDFITYVKHDKTEKVGNDETHLVKNEMQHTVEKNQTVTVGSNEHKTAKDDYVLNVGANRTKSVGGSEKVSVGESESLKVDGNDTETVASMRRTIAGRFEVAAPDPKALAGKIVPDFPQGGGFQVNKPDPKQILSDMISLKGAINRMSEKAIIKTVGAAYIQLAGAPIFSQAGKLFVEAVGGLKLTVAASETIMQSVSGRMLSTVGGLILKKSKDSMTISAEDTSVTVGGLARFHSDVKVEVRSKSIEITAPGGVTLKQGDLVLDLQPDKTTIKGDVLLNSGKKVTVVGRPDKLTH